MSESRKDLSIIVTGGAQGIGEAIVRALAQDEARVVVADLNGDLAQTVAQSITDAGGRAIGVQVDITSRASVKAMIAATVAAYGRLDVIFNNAGIAQTRSFLSITEDDWHKVVDTNALGTLICMQEAAHQLIAQGDGGKIINTASIAGKQGYEPLAHYSASKFAVVALTQAGARALAPNKITVNAICPGVVATPMWDVIDQGFQSEGLTRSPGQAFNEFASSALLGRSSQPQDLVGVSRFLAGPGSDFMTGQSLLVDGGMVLS